MTQITFPSVSVTSPICCIVVLAPWGSCFAACVRASEGEQKNKENPKFRPSGPN